MLKRRSKSKGYKFKSNRWRRKIW